MDRKNYDPEVISTFDIIGCYFVDIYYNHLYLTASDIHSQASRNERAGGRKATSLTEEYKNAVSAYMQGVINDERYYKKTVTGMQKFYQSFTKYSTISLTEFIDRIINTFLPPEYATSLRSDEKEFFLNDIISSVIKEFSIRAVDIAHLRQIIDNHTIEYNTRAWVEELIDLQIVEREKIFNKFTQKRIGGRGQQYEKVDIDMVRKVVEERDKIWHELESKVMENSQLAKNLSDSKSLVVRMHKIIKEYETQIADLKNQLSEAINKKETKPEVETVRRRRQTARVAVEEQELDKSDNAEKQEGPDDETRTEVAETPRSWRSRRSEPPKTDTPEEEEPEKSSEESKEESSSSDSEDAGIETALKKIEEQETPRVGFRLQKRRKGIQAE